MRSLFSESNAFRELSTGQGVPSYRIFIQVSLERATVSSLFGS